MDLEGHLSERSRFLLQHFFPQRSIALAVIQLPLLVSSGMAAALIPVCQTFVWLHFALPWMSRTSCCCYSRAAVIANLTVHYKIGVGAFVAEHVV